MKRCFNVQNMPEDKSFVLDVKSFFSATFSMRFKNMVKPQAL